MDYSTIKYQNITTDYMYYYMKSNTTLSREFLQKYVDIWSELSTDLNSTGWMCHKVPF